MIPRVLVIAGSDSGGGAGIQADVKTVTMLGGHAMTAITALTAQNTLGVQGVMPVPAEFVVQQMRSCIDDIGVDAVKIGMIGSAETVHAVADVLETLDAPVVFDPVMVATSGAVLADPETTTAFTRLMRRAAVVTPNLPELAALGGESGVLAQAPALLVKGGHAEGDMVVDRLVTGKGEAARWKSPRLDTRHTHGTGCTLASGIATGLARGLALPDAIALARTFVRCALQDAPGLGGGHGPMGHSRVRLDGVAGEVVGNQVTLPATDHAASAAFYAALGLRRIVDAAPRYTRFETDGGTTLSIEDAALMGGRPRIYLEVGDLDAAVARARAAGAVVDAPVDQPWGWREARLSDPTGNLLCLYQAGEMRRFPPWRIAGA